MTRILVTGAAGLLGTEICTQLKNDPNNYVVAVDNLSRSATVPPCDEFHHVNLRAPQWFENFGYDFDQIYHYSAINGTTNFYERPNEVLTNNFISDVNIFEFASSNRKLQKLVYASTSEIVSDDPICPVPELVDINIKNIHNARWSYRIAKIASENYLTNSKLPWVVVRYFNVYGKNSKKGHFIGDQLDKIRSGVFEVIGGDETRSFCYIEDAIKATIFVANNATNEVINIGNDEEISIFDAVDIIAQATGHTDVKWTQIEGKEGSTKRRQPDISKLRSIMPEYSPRPFSEGVLNCI